jgi:hypothetical protein
MTDAGVPRVVVAHLTDEELDVLTDGRDDVVSRPHLSVLEHEERAAARRAAARSLTARGLLPAEGSGADGEATSLGSVLSVRAGAPEVVVLHRRVGETSLTRYLFVLDPVVVCEDLTEGGVHTLSVVEAKDREALGVEFLVPPDAAPAPERTSWQVPGGTAAADLLATLGHPVVLAESVQLHTDRPPSPALLLALGPTGCYVLEARDDTGWTVQPCSPSQVAHRATARAPGSHG